jgi:hypothetical protein
VDSTKTISTNIRTDLENLKNQSLAVWHTQIDWFTKRLFKYTQIDWLIHKQIWHYGLKITTHIVGLTTNC